MKRSFSFLNGGRPPFLRIRLEFTCILGISIQETLHFINYKDIIISVLIIVEMSARLMSVTQHVARVSYKGRLFQRQ